MKPFLIILAVASGILGCSKKDTTDPAPPTLAPGTGSYKLDGRLVTCTGTATLYSPAGANIDYLFIRLTTTPQPAAGPEALSVEFVKPAGAPISAYRAIANALFRDQVQPILFNPPTTPTLTGTAAGGYTGTFATTSATQSPALTITDGVFTDVRP